MDRLRNAGSIEGGVFMQAGADRVSNAGTIDHVDLGGGDDVYIGRGSGYADSVDGGGGADKLTGSRADDTFIGGGAKRHLHLRRERRLGHDPRLRRPTRST